MAKGSFLMGHLLPGIGFFLIGLWHLFNHINLHLQNPKSYIIHPWFPTPVIKHLELFLIMIGSSLFVSSELFQLFHLDPGDGTIPTPHLRNFEHASIGMAFVLYSSSAIALDLVGAKARYGLTHLLAAVALAEQLLMFHLHSGDHMGLEGQYHFFVQILTFVAMATAVMGIGFPRSFTLGFSKSVCVTLLGAWLMATGIMLWTPKLIPKGCSLEWDGSRLGVHCKDHGSLHRAKALVNIEFSWYLIAVMIFSISLYLFLFGVYKVKVNNFSWVNLLWGKKEEKGAEKHDHDDDDGLGL